MSNQNAIGNRCIQISRKDGNQQKISDYMQQTEIRTRSEILKKQLQENIKTDNEAVRYMQRADIASRKELQITKLCFSEEGEIIIYRELFGEDFKRKVPFRIVSANILVCMDSEKPRVLLMEFAVNDHTVPVFVSLEQWDSRAINIAFNRAGISFGFSHGKETTMRCELVGSIQKIASVAKIPCCHGWYQDGKEIKFAFPESTTWEEIERYVGI